MKKLLIALAMLLLFSLNVFSFTFTFDMKKTTLPPGTHFRETRDNYDSGEYLAGNAEDEAVVFTLEDFDKARSYLRPEVFPTIVLDGTTMGLEAGDYIFELIKVEPMAYTVGNKDQIFGSTRGDRLNTGPKALIVVRHNGRIVCNSAMGAKAVYDPDGTIRTQGGTANPYDQITCLDDKIRYRITGIEVPKFKETFIRTPSRDYTYYLPVGPEGPVPEGVAYYTQNPEEVPEIKVHFCISVRITGGGMTEWSECMPSMREISIDEFAMANLKPIAWYRPTPENRGSILGISETPWGPVGVIPQEKRLGEKRIIPPLKQVPPYPFFILEGHETFSLIRDFTTPETEVWKAWQYMYDPNLARLDIATDYTIQIHETDKYAYQNLLFQYGNVQYMIEPKFDTSGSGNGAGYPIGDGPYRMYFNIYRTNAGEQMGKCCTTPTYALEQNLPQEIDKCTGSGSMMSSCGIAFLASRCHGCSGFFGQSDGVRLHNVSLSRDTILRMLLQFALTASEDEAYALRKILEAAGEKPKGEWDDPEPDDDDVGIELCGPDGTGDGIDNDGDGLVDEGCAEDDDDDAGIELCGPDGTGDGIDNDGDGLVDEGCEEEDDGCGDTELCGGDGTGNGIDDDCDDQVDEGCEDEGDSPVGTYDYYFYFGEGHFDDIKSGIMPRWYCSKNNTSISDAKDEIEGMDEAELGDLFYDDDEGYLSDGAFEMKEHESGQEVQCSATDDFYGELGTWVIHCRGVKYDIPYKWILKRPDSCSGNAGLEQAAPYGWQIDDSGEGAEVDLD